MRRLWLIPLVLAMIVAACSPDVNEQANRLLVEAQQLIEKANKELYEENFYGGIWRD